MVTTRKPSSRAEAYERVPRQESRRKARSGRAGALAWPRPAYLLLIALLLLLVGCTNWIPTSGLPYPIVNSDFDQNSKLVTVPLPVIAASPNEGVSSGALAAFLLHNKRDEVSSLIAPQVNYNDNFGITGSLYGAFYTTGDRYWEVNLSKSTKVNDDYELKFQDRTLLNRQLELNAFLFAYTDGSARFFGFRSDSRAADETNFADAEKGFNLSIGYQLTPGLQLIAGDRFRKADIETGAIVSLPNIRERFTPQQVPGLDGFTTHAQRLSLVYSTLDSPTLPTGGVYALASAETSFRELGSNAEYLHYYLETKGYLPLAEQRFITVGRLAFNQTVGSRVPFLEQSILGGENTLRGYGRNRFMDHVFVLANLEERIRLFRWEVFDVLADWELAPFVDLGGVASAPSRLRSADFVVNPGVGFRAVVRPNIVGRIDVGWSSEGAAVFVGLGYPF